MYQYQSSSSSSGGSYSRQSYTSNGVTVTTTTRNGRTTVRTTHHGGGRGGAGYIPPEHILNQYMPDSESDSDFDENPDEEDGETRGASESEINRLPCRHVDAAGAAAAKECIICLAPFEAGDEVKTVKCFHQFHKVNKFLIVCQSPLLILSYLHFSLFLSLFVVFPFDRIASTVG